MKHVVIGNGPSGVVAAETLRKLAPRDEILLLGDEPGPAYSRMAIPYLLVGDIDERGTQLRKDPGHFERLRIGQRQARVERVDVARRKLVLEDGTQVDYDRLLIATGSQPVRPPIPGIDLSGVSTCWTLADARDIIRRAKPGMRVLLIGAGFIGCIIMEALAARGFKLTVVEMGDRMVPRMMTATAGAMIRAWVEDKGIPVHLNTRVESVRKVSGALTARLSNGEELATDLVICAAGVRPNAAFLKDSPIRVNRGIVVDEHMQTSVPGVFAAGDVTEAGGLLSGEPEVVAVQTNAADQARIAAMNMAGVDARFVGSLAINVLDTLGLISTSCGQWWGEKPEAGGAGVEIADRERFHYLSLQFRDDAMIGATAIGWTEHVGVLRGLIQGRVRLGKWKERLLGDPTQFMTAYLGAVRGAA
jgi:NAD(P)H-nitrite reductase large subunit